ncbi:MAG TPA: hypothetical protein VMT61_07865 [Candidatus Binataceae bacterium]|nr:hypothetical protein [Candidatus Binataceae bacterium]
MPTRNARFEFRIWGSDLSELTKQLERCAELVRSTSSETYFLSGTTDRCNAKVRDDVLDIKMLVEEYQGLERWHAALKVSFPVPAKAITGNLFPELNLAPPPLHRTSYRLDQLIDEVIRPNPDLAIADITKVRFRCSFANCLAEFAQVFLNAEEHQTIALESTDPIKLLSWIKEFGLTDVENLNYVRYLKRVLGLYSE